MAQLITTSGTLDSVKTIEDKTRALQANQGLNDNAMWLKIDTEIASAVTAGTLLNTEAYPSATTLNKHGNK